MYGYFQCVTKNNEEWLKFFISYMVYSQIWLNLPRYHSHFFYIFLWMITTLSKDKNSFKNTARHQPIKRGNGKRVPPRMTLPNSTSQRMNGKDKETVFCWVLVL
jgi:hypothetical protein